MSLQPQLPGVLPWEELPRRVEEVWQAESELWLARCALVAQLDDGIDDAASLVAELACLLSLSSIAAGRVYQDATGLRKLPAVADAVLAGRLDAARARVVLELLTGQPEQLARLVLAELLAGAEPVRKTTGQLKAWISKQLLALAPDEAAERRRDEVRRQTGVRNRPLPDGLAEAVITGPADRVHGFLAMLDRSLPPVDPSGLVTRGQQRFDTLLGLFGSGAMAAGTGVPDVILRLALDCEPEGYRTHVFGRPLAQPEPTRVTCDQDGLALIVAELQATLADLRALPGLAGVAGARPDGDAHRPLVDLEALRAALLGPTRLARTVPVDALPVLAGYGAIDPAHAAAMLLQQTLTPADPPRPPPTSPPRRGKSTQRPEPPPSTVRELRVLKVERVLVDPLVGACAVDDVPVPLDRLLATPLPQPPPATDAYRFTAAQRRVLLARDQTCTRPGCRRASSRCDLDHLVPWPKGPTTVGNAGPKCRRDHRLKHDGWMVTRDRHGVETWTSPLGRSYRNTDRD